MDEGLTSEEIEIINDMPSRLAGFSKERGMLIPVLQMIQDTLGYLPPEVIAIVADYLDLTESDVYGVATFYNQFRFNPPGKNPIKVCLGTACHVKGGDIILENFERKLEIKEGETTPDREFSIERVACVGCCAIAPVALVGETVHGNMAPSKVEGLILRIQVEKEKEEREKQKE
ncbi:MAG: NADH-quinone oxidoreductase subunit NuoE [Thermodesulfobacteriota bacterium]|nr:NADH-quinone oxidoreductase subunit NuoE [Thermodesulfobacteriota bacterium]